MTDSDGRYRFSRLPTSGIYTVTPALSHYTLSPRSLTINTTAGDRVADFGAAFNHHDINGRVTDGTGSALAGVTVLLSGSQTGKETTNADGNYSFPDLPAGGEYTVTPSKTLTRSSPRRRLSTTSPPTRRSTSKARSSPTPSRASSWRSTTPGWRALS